jgi:hypothetical protein
MFLKKINSRERAEFKRHRTTDLQFRSTIETKRELLLIGTCLRHLKLSAWGTFSIRSNSCFVGLLACRTPNSALLHVVGKVSCDGSDIFASTGSRKTRVSWHWRRGRGRVSPCEGCWCPRRAAEVFRCLRGFEGTGRFWSRKAAAAACLDRVKVPWLRQLKPRTSRTLVARPPLMREMVAAGKSSVYWPAKYEGDFVGFATCFKCFLPKVYRVRRKYKANLG